MDAPQTPGPGLRQLTDDALIELIKVARSKPAANALILRHIYGLQHWVARRVRRFRLPEADVEDLRQEVFFWLVEAIDRYERGKGCQFRTFAGRVAGARLVDCLKALWRYRDRFPRAGRLETTPPQSFSTRYPLTVCYSPPANPNSNPVAIAEQTEFRAHLEEALGRLDHLTRLIWEGLISGESLRAIVIRLGISYPKGKRVRKVLVCVLRTWFAKETNQG